MLKHSWFARVVLITAIAAAPEADARTMRKTRLTRVEADVYHTPTGEVVRTVGCTSTARFQPVIIDRNDPHSRVYFLDAAGEVEDECPLRRDRRRQ